MLNIGVLKLNRTVSLVRHVSSSGSQNLFGNLPTYESNHSLGKIYPKSSLSISSFKGNISNSEEKFSGYIPMKQLNFDFNRSSGPGGQNVNKVNSKVTLSFHLESADWIPLATREKLSKVHKNSISKEGNWIIRSDKTRKQFLNIADCLDKLRCYIAEVEKPPKVEPVEILEKKRLAVEKMAAERLRTKRHSSMLKNMKSEFY